MHEPQEKFLDTLIQSKSNLPSSFAEEGSKNQIKPQ